MQQNWGRNGGGGVHIPWVESYGIWTPGSIFNGGPYSISHRQGVKSEDEPHYMVIICIW